MKDIRFSVAIKYWWAFCVIAAVTFASGLLEPYVGYRSVGFILLITVLGIGFFSPLGPVLFSAAISALAWNLFFIPPRFELAISSPDDIALCAGFFIAAAITGILTSRSRAHEALANEREARTLFLYEAMKDILELSTPEDFVQRIAWRVEELLGGKCRIVLGEPGGSGEGQLVYEIKGRHVHFGELIYSSAENPRSDQITLLSTLAQHIGLSLERLQMEKRLHEAQRLEESERLHQTLLNSVSHELRTPLTTLMGYASSLKEPISDTPEYRKALSEGLIEASERMNRVVGNLLDMSRLNSGALSLRKDWHDINDLIGVVLNSLKSGLRQHSVSVAVNGEIPLVSIDFQLMEHVLSNLIINAATYSPPQSKILIEVELVSNNLAVSVNDEGPGIPESSLTQVFEKFYRAPGTPPGGTGLGLSIVKGIVELHSGSIIATNRPYGGARFTILLPLGLPPPHPREESHD